MMPPEFRQQLIEYKDSCEEDLAMISQPGAIVAPEEREQLQEIIGLIARILEIGAAEEVTE
jgi:hypothetical protein